MVEVFKTNIAKPSQATLLCQLIGRHFNGYSASFDLEDCDRVLRVVSDRLVDCDGIVALLESSGYRASILADEVAELWPPTLWTEKETKTIDKL